MARKKKQTRPTPSPSGNSRFFRALVWLTVVAGIAVLGANVVSVSHWDLRPLKPWFGHPESPDRKTERKRELPTPLPDTPRTPQEKAPAAPRPNFEALKKALREKIRPAKTSSEANPPKRTTLPKRPDSVSPRDSKEKPLPPNSPGPAPAADGPPPTPPPGSAPNHRPASPSRSGVGSGGQSVPGALTREARRAALRQVTLPPGFTAEISGGKPAKGLMANEISRGNPQRPRVALTFDADWDSQPTGAILDTLQQKGVSATFFLTGRWAERNPDLVRRIVRDGHELANHSYSHLHFPQLSSEEILTQVTKTDQIFQKLTGQAPMPYFRPPFGDRDPRSLRVLIGQGYLPIYWSLDTHDWMERVTGEEVLQRIVKKVQPGDIILLHATTKKTAEVLPQIIAELDQKGYSCGSVSSVLVP